MTLWRIGFAKMLPVPRVLLHSTRNQIGRRKGGKGGRHSARLTGEGKAGPFQNFTQKVGTGNIVKQATAGYLITLVVVVGRS